MSNYTIIIITAYGYTHLFTLLSIIEPMSWRFSFWF